MKTSGPWLVRQRAALAHATDFAEAYALLGFHVRYDETTAEASFIIRHTVRLEGFEEPQTLSLNIRPENIRRCVLTSCHDGEPALLQSMLDLIPDNAVKSAADVLSLDLTLEIPGRVICPLMSLPIHPRQPG